MKDGRKGKDGVEESEVSRLSSLRRHLSKDGCKNLVEQAFCNLGLKDDDEEDPLPQNPS